MEGRKEIGKKKGRRKIDARRKERKRKGGSSEKRWRLGRWIVSTAASFASVTTGSESFPLPSALWHRRRRAEFFHKIKLFLLDALSWVLGKNWSSTRWSGSLLTKAL